MLLRKVFGPKRDEVRGEWRILHNEELYDLCSLPNTFWVIQSRIMQWLGHVAHMGDRRDAYSILVGRPNGKRTLGKPRHRWKIILE
jgi:hypothetical protein